MAVQEDESYYQMRAKGGDYKKNVAMAGISIVSPEGDHMKTVPLERITRPCSDWIGIVMRDVKQSGKKKQNDHRIPQDVLDDLHTCRDTRVLDYKRAYLSGSLLAEAEDDLIVHQIMASAQTFADDASLVDGVDALIERMKLLKTRKSEAKAFREFQKQMQERFESYGLGVESGAYPFHAEQYILQQIIHKELPVLESPGEGGFIFLHIHTRLDMCGMCRTSFTREYHILKEILCERCGISSDAVTFVIFVSSRLEYFDQNISLRFDGSYESDSLTIDDLGYYDKHGIIIQSVVSAFDLRALPRSSEPATGAGASFS